MKRPNNQRVTSEILDRMPPADLEAERWVLGSLLLDPQVCDDIRQSLGTADFYAEANATLFRHLMEMADQGQPIDVGLLRDHLQRAGDFEAVGGAAYLAEVIQSVAVAAHAVYYAEIVRTKSRLRALIHAATETLREAYDQSADPAELSARAEAAFARAAETGRNIEIIDAATAADQAVVRAREARARAASSGLSTGLADFDYRLGGLFPGELAILAARPRMGKTSLGLQVAAHVAQKAGPVLFVSQEMSAAELFTRILCARAGVDANGIRTGRLTDNDLAALEAAAESARSIPMEINDWAAVSVADVRAIARRIQRRSGLALVVIDYLQRLEPKDLRLKRHEQVGQLTRDLKRLARDLDLPVLCLAQLNRGIENEKEHRPKLSHLRESGDVEQDADVVMFLHREELFRPQDADWKGKALLIVEKNRNGPAGEFDLWFDAPTTTFRTPARQWEEFGQYDGSGGNRGDLCGDLF